MPNKIVAEGIICWESFLGGFFIGKRLAYPVVKKHLKNRWISKEPLELKHLESFLLRLSRRWLDGVFLKQA